MRLILWVTALAVLSLTHAKNSTAKTKPKRQLENIRTPQNLQYSLVLPHSRVTHFRSLTSSRRIAHVPNNGGKLPPYAVQMEPVVQYSQKDPLYDPNLDNLDDAGVNKNEIYAQPKILNVHDNSGEGTYGPPYGSLPTAPLYSQEPSHPHYYEAPEPIIEIIIKESNETLPAPPPTPAPKKKKEPVHVFYVKYSKDPHSKDKVIYEKPIPAITPPTNHEDDHHHDDYVTVTPEPIYAPTQTTTLRAIIKPESEVYHSDSSVKITFGNEGRHYSDRHDSNAEGHEETAPRPAIAFPNPSSSHPPLQRSASPKPQHHESPTRPVANHPKQQSYKPVSQHAQSRIQFQPQQYIPNEQQLPRQGPSIAPFKLQQQVNRQNPFGPSSSLSPHPNPHPPFSNASPGPIAHFGNNAPTIAGPAFSTSFPRPNNPPPTFLQRPNSPSFAPRPHLNGPSRPSFHTGPQRPFYQPQSKPFFDEPKYLQENYHTITTDQVDPPKEQVVPNRQPQNFNFHSRPSPSPPPSHFQEQHSRPQFIPLNQQLPQQRPPQHFVDSQQSFPVNPSRPPFFNLKPSPPKVEDSRPQFQQQQQQHQAHPQFGFHQGPQILPHPTPQLPLQHQPSFSSSPSPSPIPQHQFLPQPSSPPLFNYHAQPSPTPAHHQFHQQVSPSERPQAHQTISPSERPSFGNQQSNFQDQANLQHQQNVGQFVPQGGEFVPSISKYEQHITVNGNEPPNYSGLSGPTQPTPTASQPVQQYHQLQQKEQQQFYDSEQEQVRQQLAENVKKQQEEIHRLQTQLLIAQQQQQHQNQQQQQQLQQQRQQQQQQSQYEQNYREAQNQQYAQQTIQITSPKSQYVQERSRPQSNYVTSTPSPAYYQSTSRTVEIKPTTQKYSSSTINSISSTPEPQKEEKKKKKPQIELPDEVPDDLRQQLLSSGILDNADISVLDYDKVGETPLESLPPDQLANFFSAGGGQQIASTELKPVVVTPNGDQITSRIDEDIDDDQDIAASENVPTYVAPPQSQKQAVEMKVVHFDPKTAEGQNIAKVYVKEDATQVEPVALNDKKYNRYLPLKVSGNQFPLPDILKGRKITSVVVLAPVETADLSKDHTRSERATSNSLKGIRFVAGDSLQDLLKRPTTENFQKWLDVEKKTATDLQSVILLVTGNEEDTGDREIYMYDISSGNINKLNGELSTAFVEAAENNSLSKDIEKLAIEGNGVPERFDKDDVTADGSENVPFLVDLSGLSLDQDSNQVSISSGYSKTKHGRSLRRQ
ncbi:bromodomain-containing protein 4 [Amyelois transitella]|uniref:bromodomain-containing protein 4 n=1 Tax=Amyelois transitella TaxID=680683 RepID=UPI00298FC2E8|nr:bromodomain-containing protein 4 [Amyelois transitella]